MTVSKFIEYLNDKIDEGKLNPDAVLVADFGNESFAVDGIVGYKTGLIARIRMDMED